MSTPAAEKTGQNLSAEDLMAWLTECIAEHLGLSPDEIEAEVPLTKYGLDSIYALTIVADIEDHLGLVLEPTVMWDQPTLAALVVTISTELPLVA